jgi:hypothetical protein
MPDGDLRQNRQNFQDIVKDMQTLADNLEQQPDMDRESIKKNVNEILVQMFDHAESLRIMQEKAENQNEITE